MQPSPPSTPSNRPAIAPNRVPPVLLVKAEAAHPTAALPLLQDRARLIQYGKWAGIAFLGLLVLSALFGEGNPAGYESADAPANYSGSYEDRMNAGIAELGGTYDSSSGTMTTNQW